MRVYTCKPMLLFVLFGIAALPARAQTAAETAGASMNSTAAAQTARAVKDSASVGHDFSASILNPPTRQVMPTSSKQKGSGNLIAPSGPPRDEINRRHFERHAGKDAGKVLFRSVPSGASIFVNHLLVGHTPLLMFIAPGKYEVEMRGTRQETGHRTLGVMPKETQKLTIDLHPRYPASVSIRW